MDHNPQNEEKKIGVFGYIVEIQQIPVELIEEFISNDNARAYTKYILFIIK